MEKENYDYYDLDITDEQKKQWEKLAREFNKLLEIGKYSLIAHNINDYLPSLKLDTSHKSSGTLKEHRLELAFSTEENLNQIRILTHLLGNEETQKINDGQLQPYIIDQIDLNCIIGELIGLNTDEEETKSEAGKKLFSKEK